MSLVRFVARLTVATAAGIAMLLPASAFGGAAPRESSVTLRLGYFPGQFSLGQQLDANRQLSDSAGVIAVMIVILIIGILVDALLFGTAERRIRRRYGLVDRAAA